MTESLTLADLEAVKAKLDQYKIDDGVEYVIICPKCKGVFTQGEAFAQHWRQRHE